jgi:hypothetical protein
MNQIRNEPGAFLACLTKVRTALNKPAVSLLQLPSFSIIIFLLQSEKVKITGYKMRLPPF